MKKRISILFLLLFSLIHAQKVEEKIINNNAIQSIVINSDSIFKVEVKTSVNKTIRLFANMEGEYAKNTMLLTEVKNDTLLISTKYQYIDVKANDKLSAHKVFSLEIILEIPENLNLYFKSSIASAKVEGTYKQLTLELNQGNATINNFRGNAIINTQNGNINLETNNATIKAKTKTGKIEKALITGSQNQIKIQSINGNINVYKTKK